MTNHASLIHRQILTLTGLLALVTMASACLLRIDTRVGHRTYPGPPNDALGDVPEGWSAPPRVIHSIPPVSVCVPELETSEPAGLDMTRGSPVLVRHRPAEIETKAIHAALIAAFRSHGIDARPLDHACHHGFLQNGDTAHYLRPTVLNVEKHYRAWQVRRRTSKSAYDPSKTAIEYETRSRYKTTYAIALELSLYRQGGVLLLQSRQAGAARLTDEPGDDDLLAVSMDRLVAEFLAGRVREVVP